MLKGLFLGVALVSMLAVNEGDKQASFEPMMESLTAKVAAATARSTPETLEEIEKCVALTKMNGNPSDFDDLEIVFADEEEKVSVLSTGGTFLVTSRAEDSYHSCLLVLKTTDHPRKIALLLAENKNGSVEPAANLAEGEAGTFWSVKTTNILYIVSLTKEPKGATAIWVTRKKEV